MFNHRCNDDPFYRQDTKAQRGRGTDARSLSWGLSLSLSDSKIFLLTTTILPPIYYLGKFLAGPQFCHLRNGHGRLDWVALKGSLCILVCGKLTLLGCFRWLIHELRKNPATSQSLSPRPRFKLIIT